MGITGQGGLLWKSEAVKESRDRIQIKNNNRTDRVRPAIVIDANEVGYKFIDSGASKYIIAIAASFADIGIDCAIVCDNGTKRHHSKRATIERSSKGNKARGEIQLRKNRIQLSSVLLSDIRCAESVKKTNDLSKEIEKQKNVSSVLPPNFISELKRLASLYYYENYDTAIECYDNTKGRIEVFETPFQADPDVAGRIISGEADCIVGGDSDYPMYIGTSPSKDIIIRDIAIVHKNLSLKSGKFATG